MIAPVVATSLVVLAACTSDPAPTDVVSTPRYQEAPCPVDIDFAIILDTTCGYLIVPEDRAEQGGRTVRVFVTRIQPTGGPAHPDPMLVLGGDLATESDYGGIAPMASRIGREVILVDARGTGFSEPTLDCPEVDDPLAAMTEKAPTDDDTARTAFLDALQACHDRLSGEGIDLSDYGLEATAADMEDLRTALGIDAWGVTTFGSASRLSLEYLRRYPEHIRLLVLDSPDFPQVDPFTQSIRGTREAARELFQACAESKPCGRAHPDLEVEFREAIERLSGDPVTVETFTEYGGQAKVLLDDAMFLRVVRQKLSEGHRLQWSLATFIDAAGRGVLPPLEQALSQMAGDEAYCVGYQPKCQPGRPLFEGAYYSILCRDIVPFVDRADLAASAKGEPSYGVAFADAPSLDVCERWSVDPAEPEVVTPLRTDVPTLIVLGRLDPFATRSIAKEAAASFTTSFIVIDLAGDHNALPSECMLSIRNAWVDAPTEAPVDTSCLEKQGLPPFL